MRRHLLSRILSGSEGAHLISDFKSRLEKADQLLSQERLKEAEDLYLEILNEARSIGDPIAIAQTLYGRGKALLELLRPAGAEKDFREALVLAQSAQDRRLEARCWYSIGEARRADLEDSTKSARSAFARAGAIAHEAGDPELEADALYHQGLIASESGDRAEAEAHLNGARTLYAKIGDQISQALCERSLGLAAFEEGDWSAARSALTEAVRLFGEAGSTQEHAETSVELATSLLSSGDAAGAEATYRQAIGSFQDAVDPMGEGQALHGLAEARLALGQRAEAMDALESALAIHQRTEDRKQQAFSLKRIVEVFGPQESEARVLASQRLRALEASPFAEDSESEADFRFWLGEALHAWGDGYRAMKAYEEAWKLARATRMTEDEAQCLAAMGGLYFEQGDFTQASRKFREAIAIFEELGMSGEIEVLRRNLNLCVERDPSSAR